MKYSQHSFEAILLDAPLKVFLTEIPHFSTQQLTSCIYLLQAQEHSDAFERLKALIFNIKEPLRLEAIGKGLSLHQFLNLLDSISMQELPSERFSPLLVGFTPDLFQQALNRITPKQLLVLKQESFTEPLQHQITLCMHACEKLCHEKEVEILNIYQMIEAIVNEDLTYSTLAQIEKVLTDSKKSYEELLNIIDQALAITWTTNRLDLITHFNQLKEQIHHQLHQKIGSSTSLDQHANGLYENLETKLYSIFGSSLQDSDGAIEGLAKFSIWYLPNYWEIGLLPNIAGSEKLELDASCGEKERISHRQALFNQVQENLNKLHLYQVSDLKKFQIFSKGMAKEFIRKNRHLLVQKQSN